MPLNIDEARAVFPYFDSFTLILQHIQIAGSDPLGANAVESISIESECIQEYETRYLGMQATLLTSTQDRIAALQRITEITKIIISRTIVMNLLSLLSTSTLPNNFYASLQCMGLTEIQKGLKLMNLVASNRVELTYFKGKLETLNQPLSITRGLSLLAPQLPAITSTYLSILGLAITELCQTDLNGSKLVISVCEQNLVAAAIGLVEFGKSDKTFVFAVVQALVGLISANGGTSLTEHIPPASPNPSGPLQLANALSACLLSKDLPSNHRQWAAQQLLR